MRRLAYLNDTVSTWRTCKLFGLFAPDSFNFSSLQPENRRQPSLAEMTRVAISSLNYNIDGYFLFEQRGTGDFAEIRIIAHVPTDDGALRLRHMLGMT